jgi:5-methylcytosine-specific restriction endonuclease McrA
MHKMDKLRRRAREKRAYVEDVEPIVIWARDSGHCHICKEEVSFYKMQLDHVVPISRGGQHSYNNIKASHADCNRWKFVALPEDLPALVPGSTPPQDTE